MEKSNISIILKLALLGLKTSVLAVCQLPYGIIENMMLLKNNGAWWDFAKNYWCSWIFRETQFLGSVGGTTCLASEDIKDVNFDRQQACTPNHLKKINSFNLRIFCICATICCVSCLWKFLYDFDY